MTLGGFLIGLALMALGFFCVLRTEMLLRYLGDISDLFGALNARWLSWKILGVALLVVGFLIAFGILQAFFWLTIGRLFNFTPAGL